MLAYGQFGRLVIRIQILPKEPDAAQIRILFMTETEFFLQISQGTIRQTKCNKSQGIFFFKAEAISQILKKLVFYSEYSISFRLIVIYVLENYEDFKNTCQNICIKKKQLLDVRPDFATNQNR
jgi:hypothetical protein